LGYCRRIKRKRITKEARGKQKHERKAMIEVAVRIVEKVARRAVKVLKLE
jgi:hypothetical protein